MNKFKEYKLDISEKNKELVSDYLKKIKNFIDENNLEEELYFDIEERVFEKLSIHKKLDQLKIKQTLNEIGEPEDIFDVEVDVKNDFYKKYYNSFKNKFKIIIENKFIVSFIAIIIFGSLFGIGEEEFFVLFGIWGTVLAFSLYNDYKNKNKGNITFVGGIKYLYKKFCSVIFSIFNYLKASSGYILSLPKKIFLISFKITKKVFLISINFIKKAFNLFGTVIGYFILGIAILMLFIVPILYNGLELGNINYISIIPRELVISYLFLIFSVAVTGIYFILKKSFLSHFIIAGTSLVLVFSFGFLGGIKVYNEHSFEGKIVQNYNFETELETLGLTWGSFDVYGNLYLFDDMSNDYSIYIETSDTNQYKIEVLSNVFTKNDSKLKEIESKINDYDLDIENNKLYFKLKNREFFKEKHEFVPMYREIKIYIPKNKYLDLSDFGYYRVRGTNVRECYKKYDGNTKVGNIDGKITCFEMKN